jgi:HlyD family secretion protein
MTILDRVEHPAPAAPVEADDHRAFDALLPNLTPGPGRRRWPRSLAALAVVVIAGVGSTMWLRARPVASPLVTVTAHRGPLVRAITATGNVRPVSIVRVSTTQGGKLVAIPVDFNSDVKQGELLAQIDDATQRADVARLTNELHLAELTVTTQEQTVAQRRAELTEAEAIAASGDSAVTAAQAGRGAAAKVMARQLQLRNSGYAADAAVEDAQSRSAAAAAALSQASSVTARNRAAVEAAQAQLEGAQDDLATKRAEVDHARLTLARAQIDLNRTRILSPVNGTVVWRAVDVGQTVSVNVEAPNLFFIAKDLREVQVEALVDETDIARIKPSQPVEFTVAAYPGETFNGLIKQIRLGSDSLYGNNKNATATAVSYTIVVSAANQDRRLLPGMTASVRIVTDNIKDAVLVPNSALRYAESVAQPAEVAKLPVGWRPLAIPAEDREHVKLFRVKVLASDSTSAVAPADNGLDLTKLNLVIAHRAPNDTKE